MLIFLADLVSKLNVGARARACCVKVNYSNTSVKVLNILHKNGVIDYYHINGDVVKVFLKYRGNKSVFSAIKIISTPGKEFILL